MPEGDCSPAEVPGMPGQGNLEPKATIPAAPRHVFHSEDSSFVVRNGEHRMAKRPNESQSGDCSFRCLREVRHGRE